MGIRWLGDVNVWKQNSVLILFLLKIVFHASMWPPSFQNTTFLMMYREYAERHLKNLRPRVIFCDDLISAVHDIERYDPCDKRKLFYTASEMQNFRLDYIWELQAAREEMKEEEKRNWLMVDFLKSIVWGIADLIKCHSFLELFNPEQE